MISNRWMGRLLAALSLLAGGLAALPAPVATAMPTGLHVFAPPVQVGPAFLTVWSRSDWPLKLMLVSRSWYWGPQPIDTRNEPYAEAPGGARQVQYWDKARMEINNPSGDPHDPWFVTNGLLVAEMVSGRAQVGNTAYLNIAPSQQPVVGDTRPANPDAPDYATWRGVTSITGDHVYPDRTGEQLTGYMDVSGIVSRSSSLLGYGVRYGHYVRETQHNIPDKFWDYLQQSGPVYVNGQLVTQQIYHWVYLTGYPISEAYWVTARVGGKPYAVLTQLYQRRGLTYTPALASQWQVQMGNVGQHYHIWRYGK